MQAIICEVKNLRNLSGFVKSVDRITSHILRRGFVVNGAGILENV